MPKKLFVLAGEVSGDLHASGPVARLLEMAPRTEVFGVGGDRLRAQGARLLYDTRQMSIMGFVDVLLHARFLRRAIRDIKAAIVREKPDVALLVDYPGMNLMLAKFLHEQAIPVVYYISPQVWAWKERRVEAIRQYVDRLLVIFRFEVDFFKLHGVKAEFVGSPVVEELQEVQREPKEAFMRRHAIEPGTQLVGLLPGSRRQELAHIFPSMAGAAAMLAETGNVVFLLGRAPQLEVHQFEALRHHPGVRVVECSAYEVMQQSDLGLVTSGTATLESLCFGMPMVVIYRTGWLNYTIGRHLVKLTSISLANIVAKGLGATEQAVPELIQGAASAEGIFREATRLLDDPRALAAMREELLLARSGLASLSPSKNVADVLAGYLMQ
ncbi:lipid-A-disaccharide synthase [Pelodictyon luteolum]|uniref:Lipid-A-disaccharide synthase n=1 Tax=Chlorobium luteolum (strain DSM 273 / BCRC 81028 / 2530) TaxID=319225 RepID=Q3B238_CHLL3|nr:lipid-A-disaccharide synthase [Pelodictyon luteolum]ABB24593.1 lipid-A-disaccharide synthase [Pelodictyon luteolum DSM 273]